MELVTTNIQAALLKNGVSQVNLTHPANLKIQTTGEGGAMLLNDGPVSGKSWSVIIRVEIVES